MYGRAILIHPILRLLVLGCLELAPGLLWSQEKSISDWESIRSRPGYPLDFFSPISGTFGEYRNHNMHMGVDFKSYGMNGHKVLATYDGFIDHISQSDKGYGISLNLYSPDLKIKTKYAHLHSFRGTDSRLELLRQAICLIDPTQEFYYRLPPGAFPVRKGDWIALTGESGTGVPHLHMEFRNEEGFINPLFFDAMHAEDKIPPTILKVIWEDSSAFSSSEMSAIELSPGKYGISQTLVGRGKIRIKLGGYDLIRSRNRNNVFAFELHNNKKQLYRKEFLLVSYSASSNRHLYYDTNRSSLVPPVYFYNLFDANVGYSIDLGNLPLGESLELMAILEDAAGNRSQISIPVVVGTPPPPEKTQPPAMRSGTTYQSLDGILSLDFRGVESFGQGSPVLEKTDWALESIELPQGLIPRSIPYRISVQNFNWKGTANGFYKTDFPIGKKDSLYFYDTSIRRFTAIASQKTGNGFRFKTAKLGILGVFSDESPPTVTYPFQVAPVVHLPAAMDPAILERYYYLGDIGSGYTTKPDVYLDGEVYPFEYNPDRKAIRIRIPRRAFHKKKYLLLEIRPHDWAGNRGKYFTDLLTVYH